MIKLAYPLFIICALLLPSAVFSKSDIIVSKYIGGLVPLDNVLYVFDSIGQSYSKINLFSSPVQITTVDRRKMLPVYGIIPTQNKLLAYTIIIEDQEDSVITYKSYFVHFDDVSQDTIWSFTHSNNNAITALAQLSQMAIVQDTVILGFGSLGYGYWNFDNNKPLKPDSLQFRSLTERDTSFYSGSCGATCNFTTLNELLKTDTITPIYNFAVDEVNKDSIILYTWVQKDSTLTSSESAKKVKTFQLMRSLMRDTVYEKIFLPPGTPSPEVQSFYVNPSNHILYVTNASQLFLSADFGKTFKTVSDIPAVYLNTLSRVQFTNYGDTTIINLNMKGADGQELAGLVYFKDDTLMKNPEFKTDSFFFDMLSEGLPLEQVAVVKDADSAMLVVGTNNRGIYYRNLKKAPAAGAWSQINKVTAVKSRLEEVITFPTVFPDPKAPQIRFVGLGYSLGKTSKISITVYNYNMEKVRNISTSGTRFGGVARSENPDEDKWDGLDNSGHPVAAGLYYVQIKSDEGETGWGKVMMVWGRHE